MELVTTSFASPVHRAEPYPAAALVPARTKGRGERVLASTMMPTVPLGFPSQIGYARWRQVMTAYRGWYYLGTRARMDEIGSHRPLAAFVSSGGTRATRQKFLDAYGTKSAHAVRPHEQLEPLGPGHPLERLFDCPNQWDHQGIGEILAELEMFLCLCGDAYLWVVPHERTGYPEELFVIPSQWVYGPYIDTSKDDGLSYYEIRPIIGRGLLRIPHEEIIHFKEKSPIHKLVGWSPAQAISEWVDSLDSVMVARFFMMKNGVFPMGAVELSPNYFDPDDEDLDRIRAKLFARLQGETKYGMPLVLPPGATYNPLVISPDEMAFEQSAESLRDWILASLQVPKEIVGIQDAGSEIAMYGPLVQFCRPIRFRLNKIAAVLTRMLASRYDPSIRIWFEDPTPESPEAQRAKWQGLYAMGACTPNEIRADYGLGAWPGGDNPLLPSGTLPYPLAKEEDLSYLDELAPGKGGGPEDMNGSLGGDEEEEEGGHTPGKPANGKTLPAALAERLGRVRDGAAHHWSRVKELVGDVYKNGNGFREEDHPRDQGGQFASGNGSGGGSTAAVSAPAVHPGSTHGSTVQVKKTTRRAWTKAHAPAAAPDPALWGAVQAIIPLARPAALPHLCGAAGGAQLWLVDGNAVKLRPGQMDFVEGGNGLEDPTLCGPDEVYVDARLDPACWAFVAYHEVYERLLMEGGMSYDDAHERANSAEQQLRAQQVTPPTEKARKDWRPEWAEFA